MAATPGALLTPWSGEIQALLVNFMPGQEGGNAIADILFGSVNPSVRTLQFFVASCSIPVVAVLYWPATAGYVCRLLA